MRVWEEFLSQQEKIFGHDVVKRWLEPLKILRYDAGNLYLEAQDTFQALWFEEHMRPKLNTLINNNNRPIKVHLSIVNHKSLKNLRPPKKKKDKVEEIKTPRFEFKFDPLDPNCTFDTFVVTEQNQMPYRVLLEVAKAQKNTTIGEVNPIYLYGKEGSGRTHLLMATAHVLKEQGYHALYVHAETFTSHVVGAIRSGEMSTFRQTYRNSDLLLIDNVDLFSNKGATQEELFHTFNTLQLAGKQIILTASTPPHALVNIEPRLISRFEWGIVFPLAPPNNENIEKILSKKEESLCFPLNNKVRNFLLETFSSSPRSLTRALEALILRSHLHHAAISSSLLSLATVKELLSDLVTEEKGNTLTVDKIFEIVAGYFGITRNDIVGKSQKREYALPRQIAIYLCRTKLKLPYQKIGDLLERDHSTIISSVKRIQDLQESHDEEVVSALEGISQKF